MNRVLLHTFAVFVALAFLLITGCGGSGSVSLSEALQLVETGHYDKAIPHLEKIAEESSDNATAWCNLGVCYLNEERVDEAINVLRKSVDLASGSHEAYEYLGAAYLQAGRLEDAQDILVTANAIDPENPRILTAIGVVEMKAGNLKQAFASTMEALDSDSSYAPALYNLAVLYRDEIKNRKLAERFFRRFMAADPSDPRAEEARAFLNPQTSVNDNSPAEALVEKAKRHMQNDDYDTALVVLKAAMEKDPGYSEAIWNIAVLTDQVLGDAKSAVELYDSFHGKFPKDKRSAQAKRRSDDLKSAMAKAQADEERVAAVPENPSQVSQAREALAAGVAWQKKGDKAKAEAFYKQAIALDGTMAEAFYNLGILYFRQGDHDAARSAFLAAVNLRGDYVNARYMLANAQYKLADNVSAADNLNAVLEAKPDFAKAHYLLGLILRDNQQLQAAKIHFERYSLLTGGNDQ